MLLTCTVPKDIILPVHPATIHLIGAHEKRDDIRQESTARQARVHVCRLNLAQICSPEIVLLSPATLEGGRSRSKMRRAMILVTRVVQTKQTPITMYAAGLGGHLKTQEEVNRDPKCNSSLEFRHQTI